MPDIETIYKAYSDSELQKVFKELCEKYYSVVVYKRFCFK